MPHVMIDAREATPKPSGLARYTFNLIRGMARHAKGYRFTILSNHPELHGELKDRGTFELVNPRVHIVDPREQVILPALVEKHRPDIFHSPSMVAPLLLPKFCKRVMTLHDTIPLSFPQGFRLDERWGWALYYALSIKPVVHRTDRILTVSEWSRQDIVKHFDYPLERISVTHNWLEEHYHPVDEDSVRRVRSSFCLPERFVFALGSHYPYKNAAGLIRAFALVAPVLPDLQLVLKIGRPERMANLVQSLGLQDRVKFLGFVPDADLPAVYQAASLFAFPSFYEGFGLPPLEAMLCGTPVVASQASSIPEVVGEAALQVDPADTAGLAERMIRVLTDPALATALRQAGFEQAARFSAERGINETIAVYDQLLGRVPMSAPLMPA